MMATAIPAAAIAFYLLLIDAPVLSFVPKSVVSNRATRKTTNALLSSLKTSELLLDAIQADPQDESQVASYISELEESSGEESVTKTYNDDDDADFDPLIGLYEVSYAKTKRANDNPVGGKWTRSSGIAQKFLKTRRSFQHIIPVSSTGLGLIREGRKVVGEAVNVISLETLFGLMRVTIILRGDAIPLTLEERTNTTRVVQNLSPLAVKALFDAPRIVVGKKGRLLNVNVGPKTSVLLDTLYNDKNVRLGMGGTSGSRFVFGRCADDDQEANEFRSLLSKPMKKTKCLASLTAIASLGVLGVVRGFMRGLSGVLAAFALALGGLIAFSGGGIEQDDMGVTMRKESDANAAASA